MHRYRFGSGLGALLLGIAGLAGCQHPDHLTGPSELLPGLGGNQAALSAPQVADVQVAFAGSLEKRGEADRAMATYLEALRQDPNRADACLRLATLFDGQGKWEKSAEYYQKALALQPGNPDVYCDVGYSFYLQGRWAEAEMNLRQAIALEPGHRRAHNNLGLVLAHLGRGEEALAAFRRAGCEEASAHSNLAFVLTLERRWPEAQEHYKQALAADPSSAVARKGLQELNKLIAKAGPTSQQPPSPGEVRVSAGEATWSTVPPAAEGGHRPGS
jgi:Tfp pilus assembly protein PilF